MASSSVARIVAVTSRAHPQTAHDPEFESAKNDAVAEFIEHRAVIEQAKGMLMFVYQIDDDAAFDVLRRLSQNNNIKVRSLAEQLIEDLCSSRPGYRERLPSRDALDRMLLTVHKRIHER